MKDPERTISYQKGFVAFVDLLGFRERVRRAASNPGPMHEIWDMLQESKRLVEESTQTYMKGAVALQFSDTVMWFVPSVERDSLAVLLDLVTYFQMKAFEERWVVRGGIAGGDVLVDGSVVFGPALVRAHDLERMAVWPRVIVDPQIEGGDCGDVVRNYCSLNQDGFYAVDYLGTIAAKAIVLKWRVETRVAERLGDNSSSSDMFVQEVLSKFEEHGHVIERELSNPDVVANSWVLAKYKWLANYHNSSIRLICNAASQDGTVREWFLSRLGWHAKKQLDSSERAQVVDVLERMAAALARQQV